jgi:hypothetical protein
MQVWSIFAKDDTKKSIQEEFDGNDAGFLSYLVATDD